MKTLVLYQSSSGSTKKYAEDIASRTNADVFPLKKFKWKKISEYDTIVFGGWVMNNSIQGINEFLVHYDDVKEKNILVFSVGMSFATPEGRKELIRTNVLDIYHIRFYQLKGDFVFERLKWKYRFLMNLMIQKIIRDPKSTPEQITTFSSFKTQKFEYYDQEKIDKIVNVINTLSLEK